MDDAQLEVSSRSDSSRDDLIDAAKEVRIRQDLALVALGKRPADKALAGRPAVSMSIRGAGARIGRS